MDFPLALRLIALLVAVCVAGMARADELAEAAKLLRAGQHQQALERVDRVLAAQPQDARARFLQGLIYAEQGRADAAIEVFQKLTVDYPELPEPHNNLAVIYASRGEYDKARMALEQSIRTHPSYATAYENLGDVYARLASQAYDKALKLDSSNAGAQHKLALVRDLVSGSGTAAQTAPAVQVAKAPAGAAPVPRPLPVTVTAAAVVAKPAAAPASDTRDAMTAVEAWAEAWSRQDVDTYLAAYARDFRTPGGASREEWERQRRERVSAPKSVAVTIADPSASRQSDGRVRVSFLQHYRSDRLKSSSPKTLLLERSADGRWRIVEERIGR
jgi:tetratricopeptide (TPR) repeat protein